LVMRRHLKSNPRQMVRSWYMAILQLPALPEFGMRAMNYRLLADSLRDSSNPGTFQTEELDLYRIAWSQPGALTATANWYRAGLRYPPKPVAGSKVKPATLILWGVNDRFLGRELVEPSLALCE